MGSLYKMDAGLVYLETVNIDKEDIIDYLINNDIISIPNTYSINPVIDITGTAFHCLIDKKWSPYYYSELPYKEACAIIEEDGIWFDW